MMREQTFRTYIGTFWHSHTLGSITLLFAVISFCLFDILLYIVGSHQSFVWTATLLGKSLFVGDLVFFLVGMCGLKWDDKRGLSVIASIACLIAAGLIGMYLFAI